jgi:hypothetical protein
VLVTQISRKELFPFRSFYAGRPWREISGIPIPLTITNSAFGAVGIASGAILWETLGLGGSASIALATSGAGTGIDIDGLADVFHPDGSFGVTGQQLRVGRGGRGGERVDSTVLFDAKYGAGAHFKGHSAPDK